LLSFWLKPYAVAAAIWIPGLTPS